MTKSYKRHSIFDIECLFVLNNVSWVLFKKSAIGLLKTNQNIKRFPYNFRQVATFWQPILTIEIDFKTWLPVIDFLWKFIWCRGRILSSLKHLSFWSNATKRSNLVQKIIIKVFYFVFMDHLVLKEYILIIYYASLVTMRLLKFPSSTFKRLGNTVLKTTSAPWEFLKRSPKKLKLSTFNAKRRNLLLKLICFPTILLPGASRHSKGWETLLQCFKLRLKRKMRQFIYDWACLVLY